MSEGNSNENIRKHQAICGELNEIYTRKNHDYGDSFHKTFEEYGLVMPCIRLEDKLGRLKTLSKGEKGKVEDESIRDTLLDLANYAIMTVMEIEGDEKLAKDEDKRCLSGEVKREFLDDCKTSLPPMYRTFISMCDFYLGKNWIEVCAPDELIKNRVNNKRVKECIFNAAKKLIDGPWKITFVSEK